MKLESGEKSMENSVTGCTTNATPRQSSKSQSNDTSSLTQSSFMGNGMTYKAKVIGECDVTSFPGDLMSNCLAAMNLLKMRLPSRKKKRVEIHLQWCAMKAVDNGTQEVIHRHELQNLVYVWKNPSSDKSFGLIVQSSSTTSMDDGKIEQKMFYAYKLDRKVDAFLSQFNFLYQLWFEAQSNGVKPNKSHENLPKQVKKELESKVDDENAATPSNMPDLNSSVSPADIDISHSQLHEEVFSQNHQPDLKLPVVNDPWTGAPFESDAILQTSQGTTCPNSSPSNRHLFPAITSPPPTSAHQPRSTPPNDRLSAAFEELRLSSKFGVQNLSWSFHSPQPNSSTSTRSSSCTSAEATSSAATSSPQLFSDLIQMDIQNFIRGNQEDFVKQFADAEARRLSKESRTPRPSLNELKSQHSEWKL